MEQNSRSIREAIAKAAGTYGVAQVLLFDAEIVSVDEGARTCVVNGVDGNKAIDGLVVRMMLEISDGDWDTPEIGSTVSIAMTSFTEPYIVRTTDLTKKSIIVGDQSWVIEAAKQQFNDGIYGGIPIVKDPNDSNAGLLKRINLLEDRINLLAGKWNDFCTNYIPGSPSVTGTPASLLTSKVLPDLSKTTELQIVNPNITHGKELK